MGNILTWLIIGLAAGLIVNLFFKKQREYFAGTIFAGVVGGFVGGLVYSALKLGKLASKVDPISSITALFGAIFLLYLINTLISGEDFNKKTS